MVAAGAVLVKCHIAHSGMAEWVKKRLIFFPFGHILLKHTDRQELTMQINSYTVVS